LARIGDGSYAAPSKLALGEFLTDEWLPAIEGTVRPSSHATYERLARKHISPHIGSVRLQALSGGHLNGLYRKLEQSRLSVAVIRGVHAVLHRGLRDAVRWAGWCATRRPWRIRPPGDARVPRHGPQRSYGGSSTTFARTGCLRCGGVAQRRA
jgi:hypothetical protein